MVTHGTRLPLAPWPLGTSKPRPIPAVGAWAPRSYSDMEIDPRRGSPTSGNGIPVNTPAKTRRSCDCGVGGGIGVSYRCRPPRVPVMMRAECGVSPSLRASAPRDGFGKGKGLARRSPGLVGLRPGRPPRRPKCASTMSLPCRIDGRPGQTSMQSGHQARRYRGRIAVSQLEEWTSGIGGCFKFPPPPPLQGNH